MVTIYTSRQRLQKRKKKQHTGRHHLLLLLNECNANLLERLYDDDDNMRFVLTMTTTTK
jgi:hypothetical protein